MGEWTWLHVFFPLADIELIADPLDAKAANVLVRTIRKLPDVDGEPRYQVRVAPHNVSPFRGGPWIRTFTESELNDPGEAITDFRSFLCDEVSRARARTL